MKSRDPRRLLRHSSMRGLVVAGLVLPGGSLLIAWAIYRWLTASGQPPGTTTRDESSPICQTGHRIT